MFEFGTTHSFRFLCNTYDLLVCMCGGGMLVLEVAGASGTLACFNAFVRGTYSQRVDTGKSCIEFLVSVLG